VLESLEAVRLQAVLMPNAADHRFADPRGFCHRARGPVRRLRGLCQERHLDDRRDAFGRQRRMAPWSRRVAQETPDTRAEVPLQPQPNAHAADPRERATWAGFAPVTSLNTIRARSAIFCGVRPWFASCSSCARSAADATRHKVG
jgi:hypothetical protein